MEKFAHELVPGDIYDPLEIVIEPELNQQILFAQETYDARYVADNGDRPAMVSPALLLQLAANTKSPSFKLAEGTGSVLAEAKTEFLGPAYVGECLRVSWRVTDAYEKRNRQYYVMEALMENDDGVTILRRDLHLTFLGA